MVQEAEKETEATNKEELSGEELYLKLTLGI